MSVQELEDWGDPLDDEDRNLLHALADKASPWIVTAILDALTKSTRDAEAAAHAARKEASDTGRDFEKRQIAGKLLRYHLNERDNCKNIRELLQ